MLNWENNLTKQLAKFNFGQTVHGKFYICYTNPIKKLSTRRCLTRHRTKS